MTGRAAIASVAAIAYLFASLSAVAADGAAASDMPTASGGVQAEAPDELIAILEGPEPVNAVNLRVHVEGIRGVSSASFESTPNRKLFSRLPVDGPGGLGAVLRQEPLSSSSVWIAFSALNLSGIDAWSLVADGSGFRPMEAVIVSADGSSAFLSAAALESLRYEAGIADVVAYSLPLPVGERRSIYLRLDAGGGFGPRLRFVPTSRLLSGVESASRASGIIAGSMAAVCLAYALASYRVARRDRAPRVLFALMAGASVALGSRGGGLSALFDGQDIVRYAASVSLCAMALAIDGIRAFMRSAGRARMAGVSSRVLFAAALVAVGLSPLSALASFVPSVGLGAYVAFRASLEGAMAMRQGRAESDGRRRASRLEAGSISGQELMTATVSALRGPLNGLIGVLDDLDAAASDIRAMPPRAAEDIWLARAEAARLETLVYNILHYTGVGVSMGKAEEFDIASLARSAVGLLRIALAGRGIRLELEAPIVEMHNDARIVYQLLYNAVNRAARSIGVRAVVVAISSDDAAARISVEDDGDAIPAAGDSAAPDFSLALLEKLAGMLGGTFSYGREGGKNVHGFELPRYSDLAESVGTEDAEGLRGAGIWQGVRDIDEALSEAIRGSAGRVLIAGNEPVALLAMKRRLEAASWNVVATVSAREALDRVVGGEGFDIVIIDSAMPEMSGFSFCESVRATKGPESVPIIVLVEAGRPDEIERAFKAGANDYISRPASGLELAARVKTHVDLASSVRRELAQAARMAEFDKYRTLALLSAGVAHEINTPNNSVLRNVPILKEIWSALDVVVERLNREEGGFFVRGFGYDDLKREIPEMLNDLYMGAQDIKKIVEGLKDYAHSPSANAGFGLIEANDSVRYAVRLLKHSITVATENFTLSLADELPLIRADRLKLTQVVVNVLDNALQALSDTSRGVRIETFAYEGDGTVPPGIAVRVVDQGEGMTAETLASVFDPFFTTKRDRGGSGLGMAVASGIVRDMGGSIELRSEPGAGTMATIKIPAGGPDDERDEGTSYER